MCVCVCWCLCFGVKLSPPYTSHNINHRHLAKVNVTTAYANISLQNQKGCKCGQVGGGAANMCVCVCWLSKNILFRVANIDRCSIGSLGAAIIAINSSILGDVWRIWLTVWIQRLRSIFTTDGQRTKQITRQDYLNLNGKGAKSVKKTCHRHPIITFRNGHKLLTSGLSCCVFILSIDH